MAKYRHHKYEWTKPFTSVRHNWSLVGPIGAVHFHVSMSPDYPPTAGLEFHHTPEARYSPDEAPHHINCPLTGGHCWHDGTSLYATETLWPMIESYLRHSEHDHIFSLLEGEGDRHFAKYGQRVPDGEESEAA